MAVKKKKTENKDNEELGYIKAHCPNYNSDDPDPIVIEFIQFCISLEEETTKIKCNDPEILKEWENKPISAAPWENDFIALKRALEDDGFKIDKFRPYCNATTTKDGNPIVY